MNPDPIHAESIRPDAAVRRARREASLAIRLLASASTPPKPLPGPVTAPGTFGGDHDTGEVQWHVEHARQDRATAFIDGWAFTRAATDHLPIRITLHFQCDPDWFVVAGQQLARPDVDAAFPTEPPQLPPSPLPGFRFEFNTRELEGPIGRCRLVLVGRNGLVRATPLFEFS